MQELQKKFCCEVDEVDKEEWGAILKIFKDANFYQTWEHGEMTWGVKNMSHLVLKKNGSIVAAAQLWKVELPVIKAGFAHVSWGPMWRLKGEAIDLQVIENMLRALFNEYVMRRGLLLKIRSYELESGKEADSIKALLDKEKFNWNSNENQYRTILLNISISLEELKKNFRRKWRQALNRGGGKGVIIEEGANAQLFEHIEDVYEDMVERKAFTIYIADIKKQMMIQNKLPDNMKMRVFLSRYDNEVVGALVVFGIGNTGMPIIAATGTKDIKNRLNSSYVLYWHAIKWLKEQGYEYFDLRGYDPDVYPGPSYFKAGFGGNDVRFIGTYEACDKLSCKLIVRSGEKYDLFQTKLKAMLKKSVYLFSEKTKKVKKRLDTVFTKNY
ncbi:MAG: GNAT family N-acetyltransferase [Desulfobacterales bacterium]|nr:GNAT family N-acetyltransferase [Desulfobacterales bacterium]